MKIFQNKNIWQKIVIILLVILLFKFVVNTPIVHAADDGVLLEPITNLFANLGDGIMEIAQKTFLGAESSGAWIEDKSDAWAKILTIAIGIALAITVAVVTILSGGVGFAVIASAVAAAVKIGIGTVIVYYAVSAVHFGSSGFYLPEYELSIQRILRNEVIAFDVNFFNPDKPKEKPDIGGEKIDISTLGKDFKNNSLQVVARELSQSQYDEFKTEYGVGSTFANYSDEHNGATMHDEDKMIFNGNIASGASNAVIMHKYTWKSGEKTYSVYYGYKASWGDHYYISDLRDITERSNSDYDYSPAYILRPTIASWYLAIRNIALVALLSILVYIGIRITLTSVAGDKAKYKQMLVDWVVALALVFLMHYIMSFAVSINELIIDAISSITVNSYGTTDDVVGDGENKVGNIETSKDKPFRTQTSSSANIDEELNIEAAEKFKAAGVEFFILEEPTKVKQAYNILVGNGSVENGGEDSPFYNRFNADQTVMVWPANDFTVQARILGQNIGNDETQTKVARAGYNIVYVVLVIYTIMFCFTYLKRVIYMAFLTLIAPIVAITYPIDKISDGKAQAFDMWIKEYIFNLLMQPMHLILYTILVGMAMKFAANNIFYAVIAIGFLVPAEKILRRFFRFDRAQTPGMFEGTAGAALLMTGLNKLMHRAPNRSKLGAGGNSDKDDEKNSKITTYKNGEDPFGNLGKEDDEGKPVKTVGERKEEKDNSNKESEPDPTVQTAKNPDSNSQINVDPSASTGKPKDKLGIDKGKESREFKRHPGRMIRRGLNSYGRGVTKRYKANKKLKGGLVRRALRTSAGVAAAGTMAAAGGIIGIATGDMNKAAQYMGAGALGGYKLGQAGVDKTANKLKEQFSEPLNQAKIGYYGEEEYERRQHEKWKEREFEQNSKNIEKIQEDYNLTWKQAKERSSKMKDEFADTKGFDSFDKVFAGYKTSTAGGGNYSNSEARVIGNLVNTKLNGKGADSLGRDERQQFTLDLVDKLKKNGMSDSDARKQAERLVAGTNDYAKNLK